MTEDEFEADLKRQRALAEEFVEWLTERIDSERRRGVWGPRRAWVETYYPALLCTSPDDDGKEGDE